jgi:hypothetical protein
MRAKTHWAISGLPQIKALIPQIAEIAKSGDIYTESKRRGNVRAFFYGNLSKTVIGV